MEQLGIGQTGNWTKWELDQMRLDQVAIGPSGKMQLDQLELDQMVSRPIGYRPRGSKPFLFRKGKNCFVYVFITIGLDERLSNEISSVPKKK